MSIVDLLLLAFAARSLASSLLSRDVPSFVFEGDAPFSVPAATMAAALTCPNGNPSSSSPAVLLVHGTGSTGQQTWAEGYVPALLASGYTACYVTLPERAMGDMQVSAEYVAYNLHMMSQLAGGAQTAVVTHSQGGPDTQWALQFWPSTKTVTRAFVALSPDFTGIELHDSDLSKICVGDLCQACLWQQSNGSHFYAALHSRNFDARVPTTAIWTASDGVVDPPGPNAQLPSATVVSVQDLCPGRPTNHITMTIDSAAYALALDALNHGGTASLGRARANVFATCFRVLAPNMQPQIISSLTDLFDDLFDGLILGSPRVSSEPAIMPYAESS